MLKSRLTKRKNTGFTLVELMIVVAIIGILAAVAIPNFQKYQAKARTSEAKVSLASIYTAEKSFQVENGTYTGCINSAGFGYEAGGNYLYTTGFTDAIASAANACLDRQGAAMACNGQPGNSAATLCTVGVGVSNFGATASPGGAVTVANVTTVANIANDALTGNTFAIVAAGRVDPTNAGNLDMWSINANKVLTQTATGY